MICGYFLEPEKKMKIEKKKSKIKKIIKGKIIRDIRTLFEQEEEEDYYELKRVSNIWNNISSMKVTMIKIEAYH